MLEAQSSTATPCMDSRTPVPAYTTNHQNSSSDNAERYGPRQLLQQHEQQLESLFPVDALLHPDGLLLDPSGLFPDEEGKGGDDAGNHQWSEPSSPSASASIASSTPSPLAAAVRKPLLHAIAATGNAASAHGKKKKRGRPKSSKTTVSSPKNAPNLYSLINRVVEMGAANGDTLSDRQQMMAGGMAPGDVFSGADGCSDSYAWMSVQKGRRKRTPRLINILAASSSSPALSSSSSPSLSLVSPIIPTSSSGGGVGGGGGSTNSTAASDTMPSPNGSLIDTLSANPAIMMAMGMRPLAAAGRCSDGPGGAAARSLSSSAIDPQICCGAADSPKLPIAKRSPRKNSSPLAMGMISLRDPPTTIGSANLPSEPDRIEFEMDELFQELLVETPRIACAGAIRYAADDDLAE